MNTGELLHTFTGHTGKYFSVVFSPDGQKLLIASWHYSNEPTHDIILWDVNTGERLHTFTGDIGGLNAVFSPDGQTLATNSYSSGTINLWHVETGTLEHTLMTDASSVNDVMFSPDGQTLASSDSDDNVHLWDVKTGTIRQTLTGNRYYYYGIQRFLFSPDGQTLAGAGFSEVSLWDVKTGELLHSFIGHSGWIYHVAFSPDGQTLASASSQDGTIRFWDVNTGAHHEITGHATHGYCLSLSPDGQTLASGGGRYIYLWDMDTKTLRQTFNAYTLNAWSISFSPDGQTIAIGGQGSSVWLLDANSGALLWELIGHTGNYTVNSVAFSPDGQTLASGGDDRTVRLWNVETGTLRQTFTRHAGNVKTVLFSADGQTLASQSGSEVYLWDLKTGTSRQIGTEDGAEAGADTSLSISLSPDGQTIASVSRRRPHSLRLWDVDTGAYLHTLDGYTRTGTFHGDTDYLSFSPDGQTIASAGETTIQFWNINTGSYHTGYPHSHRSRNVVFSLDGQTIASGHRDGTVMFWDIPFDTPEIIPVDVNDDDTVTIPVNGDDTVTTPANITGLVAYYPFDGNPHDVSENGNHGRIIGTASYIDGKFGDALVLDGDGYVEMQTSDSLHGDLFKRDPFSLAVWVYREAGLYEHVWRSMPSASGLNTLFIFPDEGIISWRGFVDRVWSWGNLCETEPGVFETDTWFHIAVTNDGEKFRIYANGEKVAETDFQETDGGSVTYRIGDFAKHITVDDYAVFSKALNEEDINLIMNTGVAQFLESTQSEDIVDSGILETYVSIPRVRLSNLESYDLTSVPYLWMVAPTEGRGGAAAINTDSLADASGGVVSEADIAVNGAVAGDVVGGITWTVAQIDGLIDDLSSQIGGSRDNHSSYALIVLESDTALSDVTMGVSSDDAIKVWMNGEVAHVKAVDRGATRPIDINDYQDYFEVDLKEGDNLLLVKVSEGGGAWRMYVGIDIEDIKTRSVLTNVNDVNKDGTVNILDLVAVAGAFGQTGENDADVNDDGTVNILDLVAVSAAFGEVAAAPFAIHQQTVGQLTYADVQQWLTQAEAYNLTDPRSLRGIRFLQQLLSALTPKETVLLANYPNPFNPETWIPYRLATPADVTVTIYAADGKLVRTLDLGHQPIGMYQSRNRAAYWDGKNAVGEAVASGVYFYTLQAGDFSATRKMLIRK